jgi:hypothetical protein
MKLDGSRKVKPQAFACIAILLMASAGDVESNPGPTSNDTQASIYPCGVCSEPVTWEQDSICCDTCDIWSHKDCLEMSTTFFRTLADTDTSWICPTCNSPNFSPILFDTPITTSTDERFSMLTESMRSISASNISTPTSLHADLSNIFTSPSTTGSPGTPQATSSPQATGTSTRKRMVRKDNFKVAVLNCNSLLGKVTEFQTFLSNTDPDIVLGTESWLKPEISNSEVFPPEYSVFRKDRETDAKKTGGGVFILARREFICVDIPITTKCELQAVELKLHDQQNVKICNFYRPPWSDDEYVEDFAQAIQQVDKKGHGNIWIGGDFNIPHVDWSEAKILPGNLNVKKCNIVIDLMNDIAVTQVNSQPTRKNNILDLFFTSNPTLVNRVTTTPPLTNKADHDIVFIDLNTRASIPNKSKTRRFLFNKADWDGMRKSMSTYKLPEADTQTQWDDLEATIKSLMENFVPQRPPKSPKQKPWMTREVITTINRRNRAFKKWRKHPSTENKENYTKLRSSCQQKIRQSHRAYTESIFTPDSQDSARSNFWNYVKHKRKDSCNIAPMRSEGVLISDSLGKANILNKQYTSVFGPKDREKTPEGTPSDVPPMPEIQIQPEGVKKMLLALKPTKAAGPDRISPRVLRELAEELYQPLTTLFQNSMDSGIVPAQWKTALVSPIFKKGDKHNPANYRPVSLTAVCCKMLEHVVAKALLNHLESHKILTDNQHGFRHERSCETQLILFVDELLRNMVNGKQTDAVVMDFSKAFDMVPHYSLLVKLQNYGIGNQGLKWIESFLADRTQRVVVDGQKSDPAPVTSGVPQGSVLGPILFLVYINDMPECITSNCRLFADDTIVYREVNCDADALLLQQDLDALQHWEKKWGMSFNPTKCNTINITRKKKPLTTTYNLKDEALENVKVASYLGVQISADLSWHNQVAKVAAKGNKSLGFIRRNIRTSSKPTKSLAYHTLVRPVLEYASGVWSPHQHHLIHSIEMVQRRAARYVCGTYGRTESVTSMLSELKWETLEQRRTKAIATTGYKIVNNLVAIPSTQLIPAHQSTRGNPLKFRQISTRTNYYKYSFFPTLITTWNSLPPDLALSKNLDSFKDGLQEVHLEPPRH